MREKTEIPISVPLKPRPRASLPRFSNEMAIDNRHIRFSPHSSIVNRSNEYDFTPPSRSPSIEFCKKRKVLSEQNENNAEDESEIENESEREEETETEDESQLDTSQSPDLKQSTSGYSLFTAKIIIVIILSLIIATFIINFDKLKKTQDYREMSSKAEIFKFVESEIRKLKAEFKNQENRIWQEIYAGIAEVISNPMKPSIFVLFADKDNPMNCLASAIGELSRIALGSQKSLILTPAQLDNDTGEVIETLRITIPHRKSVIFWDLLNINDEALKAFHNLCDRENPLIKEAIYIIAVKTEGYSRFQSPLVFIENRLKSNLSRRIDEDSIMPLITRITDGPIISVSPETQTRCKLENIVNY